MSGHSRSSPRPGIYGVSMMDVMDSFDLMLGISNKTLGDDLFFIMVS